MKNIHVLPTDNPSQLYAKDDNYKLANSTMAMDWYISSVGYKPHHVYITDDSEIKEGDWVIANGGIRFVTRINNGKSKKFTDDGIISKQSPSLYCHLKHYKKIILTTDQDLIADGVQEISEDFLHWFVKNPSCESVEVKKGFADGSAYGYDFLSYKIIIPQEEPKQERVCNCGLKESEHNVRHPFIPKEFGKPFASMMPMFEKDSKQEPTNEELLEALKEFRKAPLVFVPAERMYSKEEIKVIARDAYFMGRSNTLIGVFNKWLEQFNKSKQ